MLTTHPQRCCAAGSKPQSLSDTTCCTSCRRASGKSVTTVSSPPDTEILSWQSCKRSSASPRPNRTPGRKNSPVYWAARPAPAPAAGWKRRPWSWWPASHPPCLRAVLPLLLPGPAPRLLLPPLDTKPLKTPPFCSVCMPLVYKQPVLCYTKT